MTLVYMHTAVYRAGIGCIHLDAALLCSPLSAVLRAKLEVYPHLFAAVA